MTHSFPTRRASELFAGPLHRGIAHVARIDDAVVQRRVDDIDAPAAGLHRRVGQGGLRLGRIAEGFADREHAGRRAAVARSEEHTSELQSLMRISYAVFCLKQKKTDTMTTMT